MMFPPAPPSPPLGGSAAWGIHLVVHHLGPSSWYIHGSFLFHPGWCLWCSLVLGLLPSFLPLRTWGSTIHALWKLLCLDISDLYLLFWPAYYASGVSDDQQGAGFDCSDLVLTIQLTLQDLPYLPLVFDSSCWLMVPVFLQDPEVLVVVYICFVDFW